jgi:hypothetical protein
MVRLNRRTEWEETLFALGIMLIVFTFFLFMQATIGLSRRGHHSPPNPALMPYAIAAAILTFAFLATRICFRTFYLLDPERRSIFRGFRLGWINRVRLLLEQEEVFGLATEGRRFSTRSGTYWAYRTVALTNNGNQEPLNDWKREQLQKSNDETARLAGILNCKSFSSPPESSPQFRMDPSGPIITFGPHKSALTWPRVLRMLLIIAFLIAYLVIRLGRW